MSDLYSVLIAFGPSVVNEAAGLGLAIGVVGSFIAIIAGLLLGSRRENGKQGPLLPGKKKWVSFYLMVTAMFLGTYILIQSI